VRDIGPEPESNQETRTETPQYAVLLGGRGQDLHVRNARHSLDHRQGLVELGRMMMQMVGSFAEFKRAMIRERTSAGLAIARAEGRVGGPRKKLDTVKRREIAESVITGRESGAEMARLYGVSQPTVSRIVAQHRDSEAV